MPQLTQTDQNNGSEIGFLNVSATVGKHSVNRQADVFLVQVLLRETLPYVYGLEDSEIPYPTGTYGGYTEYLILKYQELSSTARRVKVWKDGFINRAVGSHVPGKSRVWTITYMNEDVYYVYRSRGYEGDYIGWLTETYPALEYYLPSYK